MAIGKFKIFPFVFRVKLRDTSFYFNTVTSLVKKNFLHLNFLQFLLWKFNISHLLLPQPFQHFVKYRCHLNKKEFPSETPDLTEIGIRFSSLFSLFKTCWNFWNFKVFFSKLQKLNHKKNHFLPCWNQQFDNQFFFVFFLLAKLSYSFILKNKKIFFKVKKYSGWSLRTKHEKGW